MEIALESVFASRARRMQQQQQQQQQDGKKVNQAVNMTPGAFQVSAKIDEESRKDNKLTLSFLVTLNDPKTQVTYEFRGMCVMTGGAADFDSMMDAGKGADSRLPKVLDVIYQRLYPAVFMLAGLTSSAYPQSTTLAAQSVMGHATEREEEQETEEQEQVAHAESTTEAPPVLEQQQQEVDEGKREAEERPVEKSVPEATAAATTTTAPAGSPALRPGA